MMDKNGIYDKDSAIKHFRESSKRYKEERDTLIDDVVWLTAKVKKAERENRALQTQVNIDCEEYKKLDTYSKQVTHDLQQVKHENRTLHLQTDTYFEQYQENKEVSQRIGRRLSSGTYKYFRSKLDGLNIREDE